MPRPYSFAEFVEKAAEVHGNRYEYIEFSGKSIVYRCTSHGTVVQARNAHIAGKGCVSCGREATTAAIQARGRTLESFTAAAVAKHGRVYDYSRVVFNGSHGKVEIICPTHGSFWQDPASHMSGVGCPVCWQERRGLSRRKTQDYFLGRVTQVHGDKYDFSRAVYKTSGEPVTVVCHRHGAWEAAPDNLYQGYGCPACGSYASSDEDFIARFVEAHGFDVQRRVKPEWMQGKELDIFVPEANLAIEFHGTPFHASAGALYKDKPVRYHYNKWRVCRDNGVRLIQVYDFKWAARRKQHLYTILHALGLSERVHARQCTVQATSTTEAKAFHDVHHHDGFKFTPAKAESFMLHNNGVPVAAITFGIDSVHRVSIRSGVSVVGGVSKLLSLRPQATMDVMLDFGGVNADGRLKSIPYWWVNPKTMESFDRRSCQKHKLETRFGVPLSESDTETSYMIARGFMRVHGAGVMEVKI